MLSGNGRHRRPRQAPALVVAAGVTGSAIAIPLLGATGASAASGATWDKVAECESGGSWSADTGNGYYGGLNLSQEDWEAYGGLTYASRPDQASRSQQIAVAERLLADRGAEAWASCGILVGLDQDDSEAGVDTGVAGDAASGTPDGVLNPPGLSNSSGSSASVGGKSGAKSSASPTESAGAGKSAESDRSGKSDESPGTESTDSGRATASETGTGAGAGRETGAPSASVSASPSAPESPDSGMDVSESADSDTLVKTPESVGSSSLIDTGITDAGSGTGRHRGSSAQEDVLDDREAGSSGSSGRHASRGGSAERAAAGGSYTVREGDSLWGIADSLEVDGGWSALYSENKDAVGADPDLILPGQTLDVGVETVEK